MHYLIFGSVGGVSAILGWLTGWLLYPRESRKDRDHEVAHWDLFVMETMGGVWDPHAGRYIYPEREQPE